MIAEEDVIDNLSHRLSNQINNKDEKLKKYLIVGSVLIALLLIVSAVFGTYIGMYKTGKSCMEYINTSCTCNEDQFFTNSSTMNNLNKLYF